MRPTNNLLVIILAIMASVFTTNRVTANDRTTAVLQHGENVSTFNGTDAFASAIAAAESGDEIYLSSGNFKGTTLTKAVKIFGSGLSTKLSSALVIVMDSGEVGLYIEGLNFSGQVRLENNLNDATFKRCRFISNLSSLNKYYQRHTNITITQCELKSSLSIDGTYSTSDNTKVINSIIEQASTIDPNSDISYTNCIINKFSGSNAGHLTNCIVLDTPSDAAHFSYTNTIIPSDGSKSIHDEATKDNVIFLTKAEIAQLFVNKDDYTLTDGAAAAYLGTDGKQVGVYGGAYPFTLVPAIPVITSSKVSPMVGEDGKLNVTITAEANN